MIDTCGFAPERVALTAGALAGRVGHYGFVSSGSAYADWPDAPVNEDSPTFDTAEREYGPLKAACERAAEAAMPGRVLIARAGVIVGPHENIGRLPWWLRRLAEGGETLAPGPPEAPIQLIDARDLAAWMLDMAEAGRAGAYNAIARAGLGDLGRAARDRARGHRRRRRAALDRPGGRSRSTSRSRGRRCRCGRSRRCPGSTGWRARAPPRRARAAPAARDDRGHVGVARRRRRARRLAAELRVTGLSAGGGARAAQSVVKNSRSRDSSSSGIASPLTSRVKCSDAMCASKAASSSYCS